MLALAVCGRWNAAATAAAVPERRLTEALRIGEPRRKLGRVRLRSPGDVHGAAQCHEYSETEYAGLVRLHRVPVAVDQHRADHT